MTSEKQGGYLLLPVAIAIALIGVIAFLVAGESAVEVDAASGEFEAVRADYVAQAGLQHGLRQAAQQGCGPYSDLVNVALGNDKYGTGLTTDLGSTNTYRVDVEQDTWIDGNNPDKNYSADARLPVGLQNGKIERPLLRFDLSAIPAGDTVVSATAYFYLNKEHDLGAVNIHELISDWQDSTATWNTMGDRMAATILATIPTQSRKDIWIEVDLTPQVQAWVNGHTNNGIALDTTFEGNKGEYFGVDTGPRKPYITVITGTPPSPAAKLKAVGTLADGTSRTLLRDVTLRQDPASHVTWQHDASLGVDAYIWEWTPTTNYGGDDEVWVAESNNNASRSLFKFAIESLPKGARILDATLSLEHESGNDPNVPISAHRITRSWEEDEVTWNRREAGTNWDSSGGDFAAAIFSTTEVGPASGIRYEWDLTSLVQGWIDGTFANHGVVLATQQNGTNGERFFSSDETDATRRPRLSVTYSCQCGITCSVAQGSGGRIVLLGDWGGSEPNPIDVAKSTLMESWGYQVDHVDDDFIYTINFDDYDLVYVSETVRAADVSGQIEWRSIGIVNEEGDLLDNIGFAAGEAYSIGSTVEVVDNSHYITAPFANGNLSIYNGDMELMYGGGALGSGMQPLADVGGTASLMVLDTGATGLNGAAAGKRVALPVGRFGDSGFNWAQLNANGRLLVQRSLEWASGGSIVTIGNLLLVVGNDASLTAQELARKSLFEGWGWAVTVIDEDDNQAAFDAALVDQDVVYVPEDVVAADLNTKLVNATVGVVSEEANLADEFGFAQAINWGSGTDLKVDRSHYITSTLPGISLTILTSPESFAGLSGARAPGLRTIGESAAGLSLALLETGAELYGGGNAAGRRVLLPWGGNDMDINHLNADGLTILQRSIEWASGAELDLSALAHWKLDETSGTTAFDAIGNNDGNLAGGANWTSGLFDGGLDFDYTNGEDYVEVPNTPELENVQEGSYTLTAWFRPDSTPPGNGSDNDANYGILVKAGWHSGIHYNDDNRFAFSHVLSGDSGIGAVSSNSFNPGSFYHVAGVVDQFAGRLYLYVNGQFQGGASFTPGTAGREYGTEPWRLGIAYPGAGSWGWAADGVIDDARIYDRALSAAEIAELATPPGPIAHWKLDETSGTTAVDSEGNHDGTLTNNPAWDSGAIDGGLVFDGSDDYVAVPHDDNLSRTSFSIQAIIRPTTLSGWQVIVNKGTTTSAVNYYLATNGDEIGIGFYNGGWEEIQTSGVNLAADTWYHVVATYSDYNREGKIYLNGALVLSDNFNASPLPNSDNLTIGRSGFGEYWPGTLDDVRIYNRVLSDAEVSDLFDNVTLPGYPGYVELYEPWSATANDSWQTVDLAGFGVPGDAVVEVAVLNASTNRERWGGVRAVGSSLDRRLLLQEAEAGGVDVLTLHVQANASAEIQHYSDSTGDVSFVLLGYWTGAVYTELFNTFKAGGSNSWRERGPLAGIGENRRIVEIVMQNTSTGAERLAGVREINSSAQRRFNLHEAQGGGTDTATLMVNTNGDGEVEAFAQNNADVDFRIVGYWSTPPGTYSENGTGLWNPGSTNWETVSLGAAGVPAGAIVNVMMVNLDAGNQRQMGLREIGSSQDRRLDLHEAENGGADLASFHVSTDASSNIQGYSEVSGTSTRFAPVGWWVLP